jgi:hypothetical protein
MSSIIFKAASCPLLEGLITYSSLCLVQVHSASIGPKHTKQKSPLQSPIVGNKQSSQAPQGSPLLQAIGGGNHQEYQEICSPNDELVSLDANQLNKYTRSLAISLESKEMSGRCF